MEALLKYVHRVDNIVNVHVCVGTEKNSIKSLLNQSGRGDRPGGEEVHPSDSAG
jgi:hypothetical protein